MTHLTHCSPQVLAAELDRHRERRARVEDEVRVEYDQHGKPAYIWIREGGRTVGGWSYGTHLTLLQHPAVLRASESYSHGGDKPFPTTAPLPGVEPWCFPDAHAE